MGGGREEGGEGEREGRGEGGFMVIYTQWNCIATIIEK